MTRPHKKTPHRVTKASCSHLRVSRKSSKFLTTTVSVTNRERRPSWSLVWLGVHMPPTGSNNKSSTLRRHLLRTCIKSFSSSTDMTASFYRMAKLRTSASAQPKDNTSRVPCSTIPNSETWLMFNSCAILAGLTQGLLLVNRAIMVIASRDH